MFLLVCEAPHAALIHLLAPGFAEDPAKFQLTVELSRITFPYLLFISLVALQGGILNSVERFAAVAATPVLLNLFMIGVLLGVRPVSGQALSWAVTAAGFAQFVWLLISCHRAGLSLHFPRPRLTPEVKRLVRLMVPGVFGAGVTQLNLVISTAVASLLPTGAVSYLYYADRLNQLPLAVVGIAVSTAILPPLSRQLRSNDDNGRGDDPKSRPRAGAAADPAGGGGAGHGGEAHPPGAVPARPIRPGRNRRHGGGAHRLCGGPARLRAGEGAGARLFRPPRHRHAGEGGAVVAMATNLALTLILGLALPFGPDRHRLRHLGGGLGQRAGPAVAVAPARAFRARPPLAIAHPAHRWRPASSWAWRSGR